MLLAHFHSAVTRWFERTFPGPTPAQRAAWPAISAGRNTLVAAPTGSGKTLTAFLAALDDLVRRGLEQGGLPDETAVVYISPLKALSNDIRLNLEAPLAGIREELAALGLPDVEIRTAVRTGDTPAAERQKAFRKPPHIVVTTPESLYVLLGSASGRKLLSTVRTIIVDEIHAVAASKRGSHLALSLERLQALCAQPLVRIGLSATQKPIEAVARFLVGAGDGDALPDCEIVDIGYGKQRDLALELPPTPLGAVMSNDQWEQVYDRVAELVREHSTTLVFVNTRRMAERAARHLGERLGKEAVAAHHGSLARELRLDAEQRLKRGELRVLVATASLELGLDIGNVNLVCQLGTPRSIAAFLQRAGRSGHAVGGVPKARLFPQSRDELVECAALLDCVRRGELDALRIPVAPLDVLAQQIVAETASRDWDEDELYALVCRAAPYARLARLSHTPSTAAADTLALTRAAPSCRLDVASATPSPSLSPRRASGRRLDGLATNGCEKDGLTRADYTAVVRMLADGFTTRHGARAGYVHRDAVHKRLRERKGARMTALMSGGTIPDTGDYAVILEPEAHTVGTVNEDFAIESLSGDVFQLGNTSYRILRIEPGRVRVEDAKGAPPNIPFWLGEAPGRSDELSFGVSRLRETVAAAIDEGGPAAAMHCLMRELGLDETASRQIADYFGKAIAVLGALPTQSRIVLERFFDESGGTQLIVHSPFGSRINRAWGLALRKRFCRQFNFELQAAATEDAIILSLSTSHSFPLLDVSRYLHSATALAVLVQALLDAPLFGARWRWNATTALALPRFVGGRKVAPQLQRMKSEDLLAAVFPDQVACQENLVGEREIPDHPLVAQTLRDCLHEAMDADGWLQLLRRLENGDIVVLARDLPAPSPLAAEIINARPYAFLDDAPLEERRTQAVQNRLYREAESADELGRLDAAAIDAVREEAWPQPRNADEMHEALTGIGVVTAGEADANPGWREWLQALADDGRATRIVPDDAYSTRILWVATEQVPLLRTLFPAAACLPDVDVPEEYAQAEWSRETALRELLRARLGSLGPTQVMVLAQSLALTTAEIDIALLALQGEGYVMQGRFTPDAVADEWCERHLLARIHRYTLKQLRREIEPVSPRDFQRFLFDWQRLSDGERARGPEALAVVLGQLEGFEAPAVAWEADLLPARVRDYSITWLDELCTAGRTLWTRLRPNAGDGAGRGNASLRSTPILLLPRRTAPIWSRLASRADEAPDPGSRAQKVVDYLDEHGASFFDEIADGARLLRTELEDALATLVVRGRAQCDSFGGLRALLVPASKRDGAGARQRRRKPALFGIRDAGRWALIRVPTQPAQSEEIEHAARVLLRRYGVICWRLLEREAAWLPPWRELVRVYQRLEARGEIRGGRFITGVPGEQFALPEAVATMRRVRREATNDQWIAVAATDPANLLGSVLAGDKVARVPGHRVLYRDGLPIAVLAAGEVAFLETLTADDQQKATRVLRGLEPAIAGVPALQPLH